MGMKKFLSRTVAVITTAAMLISYGGVMSTEASEYEPDSEEESIVLEEEYTTEEASEDVTEEEAKVVVEDEEQEDEEIQDDTDEATEESTTEATTSENTEVTTEALPETDAGTTADITNDTTEVSSEAVAEAVTEKTTEDMTVITSEASENGETMTTDTVETQLKDETNGEIFPASEDTAIASASLMYTRSADDNWNYTVLSESTKTIEVVSWWGDDITSLSIPSKIDGYTVVSISAYFKDSTYKLTSITIPATVTNIGTAAFSFCDSLTKINVNSNNTKYSSKNGVLYNKKQTKLIAYPVGKSGSFTIPSSVKSIGDYAFAWCTELTSVTIPTSVTSIGKCAFRECVNITSVTIPKSVTNIGKNAFCMCSKLKKITVNSGNTKYSSKNGVLYNKKKTKIICYPCAKSGSFTIPSSVTSIADNTFYMCEKLTSVTIPSSVTSIGDWAFYYCMALKSVKIAKGVESIGEAAFYYCMNLTSITIPSSVTSIGYAAFSCCESLTSISIPNSVTSIGEWAFAHCDSLTDIEIPKSVTSIGEAAFYNCSGLKNVTIPDSVTSIGQCAFSSCTSLTSVEIPSSVTSIGNMAFCSSDNLTDIYYTGTETKWNKISFGDNWNYNCPDDQTIFYGIKSVSLKSTSYTYDGNAKKPGVVVKDADGNTLSSKYYTVTYKNNKKVGTGTVSITFKNGYSGTATQTFIIKPKGTTLSSVTKSSKAFTVKWNKQSQKMSTSNITGYQIQYSTSSSFSSGNKTVTVNGYTKTSKKITGLKSNTKYYVRIRTYKSISGTKYYSGWSSAKSVTTK